MRVMTMSILIKDLLIPGLLVVITSLSSYMVHVLKETRKTNNANATGTMLLLRRQIISDHERFCQKGEPMSKFDFEDIVEIHNAYKSLGGNGLTDKMYDDLQGIDIKGGEI